MANRHTPFSQIRRKIVLDALEKYKDTPSTTLARILFRDNPLIFKDTEDARGKIRMFRGKNGNYNRSSVKFTKYYQNESMA